MTKELRPLTPAEISEAMRQIGRKGGKSKSKKKLLAIQKNLPNKKKKKK